MPSFDAEPVDDRIDDVTLGGWKHGAGATFHVAWNKATIIGIDYGVSAESTTLYTAVGQEV